jgi:hypothetical protein
MRLSMALAGMAASAMAEKEAPRARTAALAHVARMAGLRAPAPALMNLRAMALMKITAMNNFSAFSPLCFPAAARQLAIAV